MHLFQLYTVSVQVGFLYFVFFCRAVRLGGPAGWPFSDQWWPWPPLATTWPRPCSEVRCSVLGELCMAAESSRGEEKEELKENALLEELQPKELKEKNCHSGSFYTEAGEAAGLYTHYNIQYIMVRYI